MTDETRNETQLLIQQEILTLAGDPKVSLTEIEARLGDLYTSAEAAGNQQDMAIIANAWEHAQIMHAQAAKTQELAVGYKEAALEFEAQRDQLQGDLAELNEAIDNPFYTDNETVRDMIEFVEEMVCEDYEVAMRDILSDEEYEEILQNAVYNLTNNGVHPTDAKFYVGLLLDNKFGRGLDPESQAILRACIELVCALEGHSLEELFLIKGEITGIARNAKEGVYRVEK